MLCVALTTADQVSTLFARVSRLSNNLTVALEFYHLPNDSIHDHITRLRDLYVLWQLDDTDGYLGFLLHF